MKLLYVLLFVGTLNSLQAQFLFTFEGTEIEQDSFLNGSDGSGGFGFLNFFLPNEYNTEFMSWSGWALTNDTDNTTPGFSNQYSSIAGSGHNNSSNYATTFVSGQTTIDMTVTTPFTDIIGSFQISNSTYAYLSMLEGDAFAKKFGGETGNDPDFFLLTIKGIYDGQEKPDSVNFYLADYRFEDNTMDYILDDWESVNIEVLGIVDQLVFTLSSSDVGQFGMNTPAYFCIDDLQFEFASGNDEIASITELTISPNPTANRLTLKSEQSLDQVEIYNMHGIKLNTIIRNDIKNIDVSALSPGSYFLKTSINQIKRFVKI